jgi:hypothetical protein
MNHGKLFSPTDVCSRLGLKDCSFRKLGDGPWAGTINVNGRAIDVEELKTKWQLTDVDGRIVSGTSLEMAVRRAGLVSS